MDRELGPGSAGDSPLAAGPHRQQGEFVLILGPRAEVRAELAEGERVLEILLQAMPASEAAKLSAKITGVARKDLYASAVARGKQGSK